MIKPTTAYAVVSKKNPKIRWNDIFESKDITIAPGEEIIKVTITPWQKKKPR